MPDPFTGLEPVVAPPSAGKIRKMRRARERAERKLERDQKKAREETSGAAAASGGGASKGTGASTGSNGDLSEKTFNGREWSAAVDEGVWMRDPFGTQVQNGAAGAGKS